ncbi:MAG TPA: decaprenyl-phosphate phosphoribosyltransferase [Bacteroidota bacterium]|nr:decaprenyl-phosphate phosphoribosyltransferase [Bacteroidota bacterium]
MKSYIRLARPNQWIKNMFLFASLIFSRHLFEVDFVLTELHAFLVFCLLSSAIYVLNDVADREADSLHPIKRTRPIAAGTISPAAGVVFALLLLVVTAVLAGMLSRSFQYAAAIYAVLNIGYSFWLKRVMLVDVFIIAAGFMLRVLAGAFAIDVEVSHWLVLCTLFVSLFLAISKRRGELMLVRDANNYSERPVLREYDIAFIDQIITVTAAGMAISYALYTVADRTVAMFKTENLIFTTVFVLFGIFRYLFVLKQKKIEDNPAVLLLSDPVMIVNVGAWFVSCVLIIYFNDIMSWF